MFFSFVKFIPRWVGCCYVQISTALPWTLANIPTINMSNIFSSSRMYVGAWRAVTSPVLFGFSLIIRKLLPEVKLFGSSAKTLSISRRSCLCHSLARSTTDRIAGSLLFDLGQTMVDHKYTASSSFAKYSVHSTLIHP